MKISAEERTRLNQVMGELRLERYPFWHLWRELADYILPKRYVWLRTDRERRVRQAKNPYILDSTGTGAARVLASGLMNGITSPSRPWFKVKIPGQFDLGGPITQWCDEVERRMLYIMSMSNFYNGMAVLYLDLVVFGSGAMLIYEDDETVIRCYNPALGEFYFGQSYRLTVDTFAREFRQTARQLIARFGVENVSDSVKQMNKDGGATSLKEVDVCHIIEPNTTNIKGVPSKFKYRETYWELGNTTETCLLQRGFNEMPGIFPRWELTANDSYGTSPAMDALSDIIQLQQETKRKAQAIDKAINPPIVADIQLSNRPTALLPNGITYIAGANNVGAKPLYQIDPPIQELTADIKDVQQRIQSRMYNDLFNSITQLDTVRSATEIDARREEKLILLGSVLERFENEALDPAIQRIFSIMNRAGLIPPAPPEIHGNSIQISYESILATAQRAVAAAPTERWLGLIGQIAGLVPDVRNIPDFYGLITDYGLNIGVAAKNIVSRDDYQKATQAEQQQAQDAAQAQNALAATQGAKNLGDTDVGGGQNAIQTLFAQ